MPKKNLHIFTTVGQQSVWNEPTSKAAEDTLEYINWRNPLRQALRYVRINLNDSGLISSSVDEAQLLTAAGNRKLVEKCKLDKGDFNNIFYSLCAPIINAFTKIKKEKSVVEAINLLVVTALVVGYHLPHTLLQISLRVFAALFEIVERLCENYLINTTSYLLKTLGYVGKFLGFMIKQPIHTAANFIADFVNFVENYSLFLGYVLGKYILKGLELLIKSAFSNMAEQLNDFNTTIGIQGCYLSEEHLAKAATRLCISILLVATYLVITGATLGTGSFLLTAVVTAASVSIQSSFIAVTLAAMVILANQAVGRFFHEVGKTLDYWGDAKNKQRKREKTEKQRGSHKPGVFDDNPENKFSTQTYYELFNIDQKISSATIKDNNKKIQLRTHPDKNPIEKKTEATEKFKSLPGAMKILTNTKLKDEYDRRLANGQTHLYIIKKSHSFYDYVVANEITSENLESATENNRRQRT